MSEATQDLAAVKRGLRAEAEAARAAAAAAAGPEAGARLAELLLQAVTPPTGGVVSAYWPMREELDPLPTLEALAGRGHPTCLPVVVGRARPLVFRAWRPGAPLVPAPFGTSVPPEDAPELEPDLLLVPLLAFDRRGYRLGYGGGFYDRTLEGLRARKAVTAVGVAFAGQERAAVPHDALDQRLDLIVTEAAVLRPA